MATNSVLEISLDGRQLIEASAGTGKTYSIGILVLRLLLEKDIPIEKILLITFTRKATNELKLRIRKFLHTALEHLDHKDSLPEDLISEVVRCATAVETAAKTREKLHKALRDLEKAQISTIHSFFYEILNRFAFETQQRFQRELSEDASKEETRSIEHHLLKRITENGGIAAAKEKAKQTALNLAKKHLEGRRFYYVPKQHPGFNNNHPQVIHDSHWLAYIDEAAKDIEAAMSENNVMTHVSLVRTLHEVRNNELLVSAVREAYQAVFVDEFQDTDRDQYEIIRDWFDKDHPQPRLFYIADPRQIIYTWRNADLEAYLEAKSTPGLSTTELTINYRSSKRYMAALNGFYARLEDPFFHPQLHYTPLEAAGLHQDSEGITSSEQSEIPPLSVATWHENDDKDQYDLMVETVCDLLGGKYLLNGAKILPGDIGILTKKNEEAAKLKLALEQRSVPVITKGDTGIFSTEEAKFLLEMMEAVWNTREGNILKMLSHPIVRLETNSLNGIDLSAMVLKMGELKILWEKQGLWKMMEELLVYLGITRYGNDCDAARMSSLDNLQHLAELLEDRARRRRLGPAELMEFLRHSTASSGKNSQEALKIRTATDQSAVHIGTIHANKGLEYPIVLVLADKMDNEIKKGSSVFAYQSSQEPRFGRLIEDEGNAIDEYNDSIGEAQIQTQQEKARLIYVALTRAQFATVVFCSNVNNLNANNALFEHLLANSPLPESPFGGGEAATPELARQEPAEELDFPDKSTLRQRQVFRMSYSFLARDLSHTPRTAQHTYDAASYDHFAYHELKRGKRTGEMLHQIFEYIDFQQPEDWTEKIRSAIVRHHPAKKGDEAYEQHLHHLIAHTLGVTLPLAGGDFQLAQLDRSSRIQELEFDFPVPGPFDAGKLEDIFGEEDPQRIYAFDGEYAGMMNGVLDLLFHWNGRYYILDWKSNFLGDHPDDYAGDKLRRAMNQGNYHLQYLLYTAALDRYLAFKLGKSYSFEQHFGGVIYLFLRGLRQGRPEGIYYTQVPAELLQKVKGVLKGEVVG